MNVKDTPRWFLVLLIAGMITLGSPIISYTVSNHLKEDVQQSADIDALTANIASLTEAVRNLKTVTENNREEQRWLHRDD